MTELSLGWVSAAEGLLQPSDVPASESMPADTESNIRLASVLIPLFWHHDEWHVLYIRRVENPRDSHSGQVAFPGGRRDQTDADATAVALREADEEIGLAQSEVRVLGSLANYRTSSDYDVTPVVGIVPWPYPYQPEPAEVDRIFSIPLKWLANKHHVDLRDRAFRLPESRKKLELKVVYYNRYDGELLWGATARMTLSFLKALHEKQIVLDHR